VQGSGQDAEEDSTPRWRFAAMKPTINSWKMSNVDGINRVGIKYSDGVWEERPASQLEQHLILALRPEAGAKEWNAAIEAAAQVCNRSFYINGHEIGTTPVHHLIQESIRALKRQSPQLQPQEEK
jgi:hypothetical protein